MPTFKRIGLIGRHRHADQVADTLSAVAKHLNEHGCSVCIDPDTDANVSNLDVAAVPLHEFKQHCDLIIVIGGDGSLIHAAAVALDQQLPIVGINRGRLGFLTDISPDELTLLDDILAGNYQQESRRLLKAAYHFADRDEVTERLALNDIVLSPGKVMQMVEFEVFINQEFVARQHADGIIVSTPTGSTAYALSAGGPIVHPNMAATLLVPICPHTLSSRPLVVPYESRIELLVTDYNTCEPLVSCDGEVRQTLAVGSRIVITPCKQTLQLIHPNSYSYYDTLKTKLGWQR